MSESPRGPPGDSGAGPSSPATAWATQLQGRDQTGISYPWESELSAAWSAEPVSLSPKSKLIQMLPWYLRSEHPGGRWGEPGDRDTQSTLPRGPCTRLRGQGNEEFSHRPALTTPAECDQRW